MKGYYITKKGVVNECGSPEEPFDTSIFSLINWFATMMTAKEVRDIIKERRPRAFMNI